MFPSPKITPPTLEDFQWYYQGFTFGANTPFGVLKVEGLDLAPIRSGDVNLPRDHGQLKGIDVFEGRDVIFDIWEKTNGESIQAEQLLAAAATNILPNEEAPLWFQLPNLPIMCIFCRVRKRPTPIDADYAAAQVANPELQFHATDPRIYTAGSFSTIFPGETLGITNTGNTEMRPIIVVSGPSARPKITNKSLLGSPFLELENTAFREEQEVEEIKEQEKRQTENIEHKAKVVTEEDEEREVWRQQLTKKEITSFEYTEKVNAQTAARAPREAEEAKKLEEEAEAERVARAKDEKEKEEKGELVTIQEGDQVLIDFAIPHLIFYYKGGVEAGKPESVLAFLTFDSRWWSLIPGLNELKYTSVNEGGTAEVQYASGYQL